MNAEKYIDYYKRNISRNTNVNLVYGRLNVSPDDFLNEATLNGLDLEVGQDKIVAFNPSNNVLLGSMLWGVLEKMPRFLIPPSFQRGM